MSVEEEVPPHADPSAEHPDGEAGGPTTFRDNQQHVGSGAAVMVDGGMHLHFNTATDATDTITQPRLREGPYPEHEVAERLRGFVEPPSAAACRKALDRRVLLLTAEEGHGVGTAALALLAERHGTGGIVGLAPPRDLADFTPQERRGYLLRWLPQQAADALGEVTLLGLVERLRQAGSHLVITVGRDVRPRAESQHFQCVHQAPSPREVATRRLHIYAEDTDLTAEQTTRALEYLNSSACTAYLRSHPLPGDAVELAERLCDAVVDGVSMDTVLDSLRLNSDEAAATKLAEVRGDAGRVSLIAAVALMHGQDRTVVERYAAELRDLLCTHRSAGLPPEQHAEPDVLGPAFDDRLKEVGAELLAPEWRSWRTHRYRLQRVVFVGRHRPQALMRRLWLDHEGMAELLWEALARLPYQPGLDIEVGQAIGDVLARASGPAVLTQLAGFATSDTRWHRRLVAAACGEMAQRPGLGRMVHEQLRLWSRQVKPTVRCTVAETCAGSYGLARPTAAVRLLATVLERPMADTERITLTAVSFALSVLLTERPNRPLVLRALTDWLAADPASLRHTLAADAVQAMSEQTFPRPGRRGPTKLSLDELLLDHPEHTVPLVTHALLTETSHKAVSDRLLALAAHPDPRRRAALSAVVQELHRTAPRHRDVVRFLLRVHRHRTYAAPEEDAS